MQMQPGVYLYTQDEMAMDQKDWDNEDPSRAIDFTQYKFWVTTDDGVIPEGFDSAKEAYIFLTGVESCL